MDNILLTSVTFVISLFIILIIFAIYYAIKTINNNNKYRINENDANILNDKMKEYKLELSNIINDIK